MKDVVITERATDGVVRHYCYRVYKGTLYRVNSVGDRIMRVCALPGCDGETRLSEIQLVYLVLDWHMYNCSRPGAYVEWSFAC